jgi:hypothetical protein
LGVESLNHEGVVVTETGDLVLMVLLAIASGDVALGPLAEAGGDLLGTLPWVIAVVAVHIVEVTTLALGLGATMGSQLGIVESAFLLVTGEGILHTVGGLGELGDELVLALPETEVLVQDLLGELDQAVETLERVTWGHLLLLGGGNSEKDGLSEFHLVFADGFSRADRGAPEQSKINCLYQDSDHISG